MMVSPGGTSTAFLAPLMLEIPDRYLEQFPQTLFVHQIRQRTEVKLLKKTFVVRCILGELDHKQQKKLEVHSRLNECTSVLL